MIRLFTADSIREPIFELKPPAVSLIKTRANICADRTAADRDYIVPSAATFLAVLIILIIDIVVCDTHQTKVALLLIHRVLLVCGATKTAV